MIVPQMQPNTPSESANQSKRQLVGDIETGDIEVVLPDDEMESANEPANDATLSDISEETFYKNIADELDPDILGKIASEVYELYQNDVNSRSEWQKTYEEGIKMLGLGIEERTEPWEGACGVSHPLMAEAAVRFQAESITETFSAQGICKSQIIGKCDEIKEKAAKRVENDINWRLTTQMKEYRPEHERMLWSLAIMGSAFKKVYMDPTLDRQTAVFISAEDLIVPYGATDIATAPRISHRMKRTPNDIRKLQVAGFYRDVPIDEAQVRSSNDATSKDKATGIVPVNDDRIDLIEMHVELEVEGYEDIDEKGKETGIMLPFVVTFDLQTQTILSIYRNWKMEDKTKARIQHFVHYVYIPGFGFYGMGLVHLVGGFANSATSLLRQLVDAGTLANLPAGFKAKGIRIQRDDDPLMPGEFRDVDVPMGTLQQNLMPLPFKEPSQTLLALFNEIVEEGRRMAAVSDVNAADMNQQAPVGTTLAILERSLKVMTAIQARLHASLKEELGLLHAIIKEQMPEDYDYDVDEDRRVKQADYAITEIIPVSDPNAATMSQRVVQYQAVTQMADKNPAIYDRVELDRQMLEVLGIKNIEKIIPASGDQTPRDPISENAAVLTGKPVKAFAYQDHEAHLKAHLAAQQDPHIQALIGQSPNAPMIMAATAAHIAEHVAFEYRRRIEQQLGAPLPQGDEKMSPETEKQLSVVMAQAAQQLLQQHKTEAAQQAAQQAAQDPVVQQQQKQLSIDEDKNKIAREKIQADYDIAIKKIEADSQKQLKDKLYDAMKFDAEQTATSGDPELQRQQQMMEQQHAQEVHQQQLAHRDQVHQLGLAHNAQKLAAGGMAHNQKIDHADDLHEQKVKHAEEQRKIAAAVAAARPHMKDDNE